MDFVKNNHISLLFDIHGMRAERDVDICIGTGLGKNVFQNTELVLLTKSIFEKHGYSKVSIDDPFNATYPYTISNFVARKAKIPCIQIEINNKYRSKRFKEFDFDHLINCFSELTEAISCFLADNSL